MKLYKIVTKIAKPLKESRLPYDVRFLIWFMENLFYDYRWSRNRMIQLLRKREWTEGKK